MTEKRNGRTYIGTAFSHYFFFREQVFFCVCVEYALVVCLQQKHYKWIALTEHGVIHFCEMTWSISIRALKKSHYIEITLHRQTGTS